MLCMLWWVARLGSIRKTEDVQTEVHRWHFMVESWHLAFPSDLNFLQEAYSAEWLISTDLGYRGSSGAYVRV